MMNFPSKRYVEWHEEATAQLIAQGRPKLLGGCLIEIEFYASTRRRFDLTNKAESVMDLLVDNGILEDDNCNVVGRILLRFCGVDRGRPRAVIKLEKA